jgi:hypothetical protein
VGQIQKLSIEDEQRLERELVVSLITQNPTDLSCLLHSSQLEAKDAFEKAPGSRFVLEVARKWGKTWLLLVLAFAACLRQPKVRVVYGAPTLKHLAEFVLPVFEALSECFPAHLRPVWNAQKGHIRFRNGSWIHLFGADDKRKANNGRGPAAVLAIFDEAGFCPLLRYVLRSIFRPSLLHSGGRTLVASTPAELPDHDFTAIAEKAEAVGAYFNRDVWDNPLLTEAQIQKFIADDAHDEGISVEAYIESDEFRREYLAQRVVNKMLLGVPEWLAPWRETGKPYRESHFVALPRPKLFRGHSIIDFGGNDPHAIALGYWDLERGIVVEHDKLLTKDERSALLGDAVQQLERAAWGVDRWNGTLAALTTDTIAGHFGATHQTVPDWLMPEVDKDDVPAQPFTRICDTNMELARHLYENAGIAVVPTYKTEKQFMVQQLRNLIADGKYWVHPRCVDTDRHLRTTTWRNEKRKEWARRAGEHGDLVDTSVYFAMGVCRDVPVDPEAAVGSGLTVGATVRARQQLEARRQGIVDAFMGDSKLAKRLRGMRRKH